MDMKKLLSNGKMVFVTIGIFIAMSIATPLFLTPHNIENIFTQVSVYGYAAVGMTFAIICGEMDLSIGANIAFSGLLLIVLSNVMPIGFAIIIVLLVGAGIGYANGFFIAKQGITSFITTMAMMLILKSFSLLISGSGPMVTRNSFLSKLGSASIGFIPLSMIILLAFVFIGQYVLMYTRFGRNVFATGGNLVCARLAAINVDFYKIMSFVITGCLAAFAGIMLTARLGSASPIAAEDASVSVISSIVIGGTSLSGGKGSMLRTLNGFLLIGIIQNAINLLQIYSYYQTAIMGVVLIVVVVVDTYTNYKKSLVSYVK